MQKTLEPRVIVALDVATQGELMQLVERLDPASCRLKVGKELFTAHGPAVVESLHARGFEVFLDLKFHDIPNTVAGACRAAADLGVWMVNVHALGGERMMAAAREAVAASTKPPLLIAVTVLTSMGRDDIHAVGLHGEPLDNVVRLARLAESAGLDGVVCSPQEVALLRRDRRAGFLLVTPGVRPAGAGLDDQQRVMTPGQAVAAGSSYLVVGRPITRAPDPVAALRAINAEIAAVP